MEPYPLTQGRSKLVQIIGGTLNRELYFAMIVIALVGLVSIALTTQGWKERIPAFDLLTYIYNVNNFLETGALPVHGDTGSYGSYKPAGTTWLMLPSALLFSDPRLVEYTGTSILHIFTLIGIYLLARAYLGRWSAGLAVMLYGFSEHSIFLAGSLWPNGRPDFYVWIVLFSHLWVVKREARYLAAGLAVWGMGMYVDMAITPVFFIFPVIWYLYRPPVRLKPLILAGGIVFLVWLPYLHFEMGRGFIDIRSQLLQQHIFPANYLDAWCDPTLELQEFGSDLNGSEISINQASSGNGLNPFSQTIRQGLISAEKLLYNFQPVVPVPGAALLLFLMSAGGLLLLSLPGATPPGENQAGLSFIQRNRAPLLASGMILGALLISLILVGSELLGVSEALQGSKFNLIDKIRKLLLVGGLFVLFVSGIASAANRLLTRRGVQIQSIDLLQRRRLLVISLIIPWFLLFLAAEPGKPERFMWLWPLHSIALAAFLVNFLPLFRIPKTALLMLQVGVVLLIGANPFLLYRADQWLKNGWAGSDGPEIRVVDSIAHILNSEGKSQASIGYQTYIYPFMAEYHITNPLYKVGSEFDTLFKYRSGVVNTNRCAEGIAEADEFRIVEVVPKPPTWSPRHYFASTLDERYTLMGEYGTYQVYRIK